MNKRGFLHHSIGLELELGQDNSVRISEFIGSLTELQNLISSGKLGEGGSFLIRIHISKFS